MNWYKFGKNTVIFANTRVEAKMQCPENISDHIVDEGRVICAPLVEAVYPESFHDWNGRKSHPIDEYVHHYKTTETERNEAAGIVDFLVDGDPQKFTMLKKLLDLVVNEALCNEAFNNSGADQ